MTEEQIICELKEKVRKLEETIERKDQQYKKLEDMYYSTLSMFENSRTKQLIQKYPA